MKVILVNTTFLPGRTGGAELHTLWVAQGLQQRGHTVAVICGGWPEYTQQEFPPVDEYTVEGVRVVRLALPRQWDVGPWEVHESAHAWAKAFLADEKPDVVLFGLFWNLTGIAAAAAELGIPYVILAHLYATFCFNGLLSMPKGRNCDGLAEPHKCRRCTIERWSWRHRAGAALARVTPGRVRRCLEARFPLSRSLRALDGVFADGRRFADNASRVIAPTEFVRQQLVRNGAPAEKTVVCRHGVPSVFFETPLRRDGRDYVHFVAVSRLSPEKGIGTLIQAFRALPDNPAVRLTVYGTGPEDVVKALEIAAAADPRIRLAGPVPHDQVPATMTTADAVVVPSECQETSGLTASQALAMGVPVLASDIGGLPEAVSLGRNGLLFRAGQVTSLVEALREFCGRPDLRPPLPVNVRGVITMAENVAQIERVLKDAAAGRNGVL